MTTIDPCDRAWCGVEQNSALEGERSALIWSALWLLQSHVCGEVCFRVDSTAALFGSSGRWHFDSCQIAASTLRGLTQALEASGRLRGEWGRRVRSHDGHPFNELADSLAKHCLQHRVEPHRPDWPLLPDRGGRFFNRFWLHFACARRPSSYPICVDNVLHSVGKGSFPDMESAGRWSGGVNVSLDKCSSSGMVALRLVSANVQTLEDPQGAEFAGRAAYIRDQFQVLGVSIAAIQEARSRHTATFTSANYIRLCSGCTDAGQGVLMRRIQCVEPPSA